MTQDQLADALYITRQALSNWETGKRVPDADMMERLSQVLEYTFIPQEEEDGGEPAAPPAPAEQTESAGKKRKISLPVRILCAVCALAMLLGIVWFAVPSLHPSPAAEPAAETAAPDLPALENVADLVLEVPANVTAAWFKQGNIQYAGEPYLTFTQQIEVQNQADGFSSPYWYYSLGMRETAGLSIALESVDWYSFLTPMVYGKETFPAHLLYKLPNENYWEFGGGQPVQDQEGFGFLVHAKDGAGNPMTFRAYIDMTTAPRE